MLVYHGDPAKLATPDPVLSSDLLWFIAVRWGLRVSDSRDLGGSFSLNVLVDGHQRIRRTLKGRGVPIPDLRPALDGSLWFAFDDCVLEVEQYVVGGPMDSWARLRVDDLALPLAYLLQTGARLAQVRALIDAYDSGCATPLSDRERRALPFAMARVALSFLQYLVLPGDPSYVQRLRQEFNEERGPACEWWLCSIREGTLSEDAFV